MLILLVTTSFRSAFSTSNTFLAFFSFLFFVMQGVLILFSSVIWELYTLFIILLLVIFRV